MYLLSVNLNNSPAIKCEKIETFPHSCCVGKWETIRNVWHILCDLNKCLSCSPWLLSTIKETDIKQELSEHLKMYQQEMKCLNIYIRYEVKYRFYVVGRVIWESWGKERQSLHYFLLPVFHVILPITSLFIWTSKETVFH